MKQGVVMKSGAGASTGLKLASDIEAYVERIDP